MKTEHFFLNTFCALISLGCVVSTLQAKPTTALQAEKAVKGWLKADAMPLGAALGQTPVKTDVFCDEQGQVIYYVVYLQPSGFVIVPADDTVEPILAFADSGTYDPSMDNPLGALVNRDVQSRISASRDMLTTQGADAKALQKTTSKWESLAADSQPFEGLGILGMGLPNVSDRRVDPLLKTKWNQTTCCAGRACYNYYTPPFAAGDPNNFPCGCVATAMAQLMRFYSYPTAGIGQHQFQIKVNGGQQQATTRGGDGNGGPYDWDSMVYEPNCNTTLSQRQAIGNLCYDAGVTVNMDYRQVPGSAAFLEDAKTALKNTFMYSNAFYRTYAPIPPPGAPVVDLVRMLNPNLDYAHPVLIAVFPAELLSVGHAIVVDGYGYNLGTMYHHINMGWAGQDDAWYNFYTNMPAESNAVDCCVYNIFVTGTDEIISGRVKDASGNILAGAMVTAARTGGGMYPAITNNRGIYALPHVPSASTYTLSVTWNGYSCGVKVVNTLTSVDNVSIGNVWTDDISLKPFCYVDANAPGNHDGSNWYNAYDHLQDALADPCAVMILVAQGTYHPDSNSVDPDGSGDRHARFMLRNGVALYGGHAGYGAPDPNARSINLYKTILSGDLADNDAYVSDPCDLRNEPTRAENSYHVVDGNGTDASAILDGFTITAGNANADLPDYTETIGGGMLSFPASASCTIRNCTFIENSAIRGGAMFNFASNMHISNCKFFRNSADDGGGIANKYNGSPQIISPQITNCTFSGNYAAIWGGGISDSNCTPAITNCVFSGNTSGEGGGIYNMAPCCSPTITNCTFSNNQAATFGGGIRDRIWSTATIANCILWDNTAPADAQISDDANSTATINYSDVQGGWTGAGGIGNIDADPCFADPNGLDNIVGTSDDNLWLSQGSPCIDKGSDVAVPADTVDLDNDADTTEQTPWDRTGHPRFADGDGNDTIIVDMGAYEFSWVYTGDFVQDLSINFDDFAVLASSWLKDNPLVDIAPPPDGDGIVDFQDFAVLVDNWLAGK